MLTANTVFAAENPPVSAKIERVTMYRQSAKVSGSATASVQQGIQEIVVTNLPNSIVQQSLQVRMKANGVQLLNTTYRTNSLKQPETVAKIQFLLDTVKVLEKQHYQITDQIKTVEDQMFAIKTIVQGNTGGSQKGASIDEVQRVDDYYAKRLPELRGKLRDLQVAQTKSVEVLMRTNARLYELDKKAFKQMGELVLQVKADAAAQIDLSFAMLTKAAYWVPIYDVKAPEFDKPLALTYKANLVQYTGVDWKAIRLFVSTGNPSADNAQPVLRKRYAQVNYPVKGVLDDVLKDTDGDGVPDRLDREPNSTVDCPVDSRGVMLDSDGDGVRDCDDKEPFTYPGIPVDPNGVGTRPLTNLDMSIVRDYNAIMTYHYQDRSGVSFTAPPPPPPAGDAGVSSELEIKDLQDIPTDGQAHLVQIENYEVPAVYEYNIVPSREQAAFLLTKIPNVAQYNLAAGKANLFFGDTYVGQSDLNPNTPNDTLLLSLGRDEKVSIKREKLKDITSSKLLSNTRKTTVGYETTLRNNKTIPIEVVVLDNVPLSKNQELIVEIDEQTGAKLQSDTGTLTWNVRLAAGETKKIRLVYSLKYPKGQQIIVE